MHLPRRAVLGLAASAAASAALGDPTDPADPTEVVHLWPGAPPDAPANPPREQITDRAPTSGFQDRYVTGIGTPLLTVFRPQHANGAAALIAPGGGYIRVVIDKEGFEVARRLALAGVTSFVLRYRLPGEGWTRPADVSTQDAQRAVRLIRAGAAGFGIDPARLAVIGCSAGGHVAASLATRFAEPLYAARDVADRLSARPDLACLLYPVIEMSPPHAHVGSRAALLGGRPTQPAEQAATPWRGVTSQTPPTFLVHALDDRSVPPENSLSYLAALRREGVAAEAHLFEEGGHGFGIRLSQGRPAAAWPDLFLAWAGRRGWLTPPRRIP
jgi:acetyl esterase/lipase